MQNHSQYHREAFMKQK